jgi:hypothetical protein
VPLEIATDRFADTAKITPSLVDAVKATVAYLDWSESEWGNLPLAQRLLRKKCRAALETIGHTSLATARVPVAVAVPDKAFVRAVAEFQRSQETNPHLEAFDHLKKALTEVWPSAPREISVSQIIEAADEWVRERAPAECGDLGMTTAFKDGVTWAIKKSVEDRK